MQLKFDVGGDNVNQYITLSKHFLQHIRVNHSAFQMTSFGCNEDKIPGWRSTFKIKGQIHHRIGSLFLRRDEDEDEKIHFIEDAKQ